VVSARARLKLLADLVHRRRTAGDAPAPPVMTQSSPGQIADLQEAYGAEMAPPPPGTGEAVADG
jgi:hypothetical protein